MQDGPQTVRVDHLTVCQELEVGIGQIGRLIDVNWSEHGPMLSGLDLHLFELSTVTRRSGDPLEDPPSTLSMRMGTDPD